MTDRHGLLLVFVFLFIISISYFSFSKMESNELVIDLSGLSKDRENCQTALVKGFYAPYGTESIILSVEIDNQEREVKVSTTREKQQKVLSLVLQNDLIGLCEQSGQQRMVGLGKHITFTHQVL